MTNWKDQLDRIGKDFKREGKKARKTLTPAPTKPLPEPGTVQETHLPNGTIRRRKIG